MTRAAISRSGATRLGATTRFVLPPDSEATAPAERRGLARDGVRLLVAAPAGIVHATFRDLGDHLSPGDLVVVNTSATLSAAVDAHRPSHARSPLHVATELDDGSWVVEVRSPDNTGPAADVRPGETLQLTGGITLSIEASYPMPGVVGARLWKATPSTTLGSQVYLADPMAGRSVTAISTPPGRSATCRTCTPMSPEARRWPAPAGRSPTGCWSACLLEVSWSPR
ncbi:MAG: S-adenosylmethionine:tRNA ribosyltransferase-isomerase [Nocardioidaceae bacterium]